MATGTSDGRSVKILTIIGEFTKECLSIVVEKCLSSNDVPHCLTDLFIKYGALEHIPSDNGPEFTAKAVREWLGHIGVKTFFIEPATP